MLLVWDFLKKIFKNFDKILTYILLFFIRIYQYSLSPDEWLFSLVLKWKICTHEPHCSAYAVQVLKRYGFFKSIPLIIERILSCKPSTKKMYDPAFYKVVFCSSANIWIPFLEELNSNPKFEICGIITQADKPAWRWMQLHENPIKKLAKQLYPDKNDDFIQTPLKINPDKSIEGQNFYEWLKNKNPDFLVVISYWKILPQAILDVAKFWSINVHGSLLPKYRGASPLQSIFLNKEKESWITIMHMNAWMDTWDIIDQLKFQIKFEWTVKELIEALEKVWPKFLWDTLYYYAKHQIKSKKQDEKIATLCQKIEKSDWEIFPFEDSLEDIYAKYRAYFIRPKVRFKLNWKTIIVDELKLNENFYESSKNKPLFDWKSLNQAIEKILLKPEWKKWMDWKSFVNWYLK